MRSVVMLGLLVALGSSPAPAAQIASDELVPVGFRLPDRAALAVRADDGTDLMDAYHVQAIPSGCTQAGTDAAHPYADTGTLHLDPLCEWRITLTLGAASPEGLREAYYQSAAFFLRRQDLLGKVNLDLSFQFRRLEAGATRGFKPVKLL